MNAATDPLGYALLLWMTNAWRRYNDAAVSESERDAIVATVLDFSAYVGEGVLGHLADAMHLDDEERDRFLQLGPSAIFDGPGLPVPLFVRTEEITSRDETTP